MSDVTCSVDDCEKPVKGRGWCAAHYERWRQHGDPSIVIVRTRAVCSIDGCDGITEARGWCHVHYQRWKKTGDPLKVRTRQPGTCTIDDCERAAYGHGWCQLHWGRWKRTGDPLKVTRHRHGDLARFWAYVDKLGPIGRYRPELGPCWLWTSTLTDDGYSKVSWNGRQRSAHRLSYELRHGAIPKGLEIDHLCMVRHCVNPAHLEAVTKAENNRRARLAASGHVIGHKDGIRWPASSPLTVKTLTLTP